MKYLKRIYNNIKYLLNYSLSKVLRDNNDLLMEAISNNINELSKRINVVELSINDIHDNIKVDTITDTLYDLDNKIEEVDNRVDDVFSDVDEKLSYDDVVDEITDKLDSLNLIEDVKELKTLSVDSLIERDLLIDEVIKAIINRLDNNANV